jgi:hypothetical protein
MIDNTMAIEKGQKDIQWIRSTTQKTKGSLKNRSIDNLETQKKSISMKNSQFFDYLLYAKSK